MWNEKVSGDFIGELDTSRPSVRGQITFTTHDDNEHLLVLALQVLVPLAELVKRLLIIDGIAEDTDTCISQEQMRKIVH